MKEKNNKREGELALKEKIKRNRKYIVCLREEKLKMKK